MTHRHCKINIISTIGDSAFVYKKVDIIVWYMHSVCLFNPIVTSKFSRLTKCPYTSHSIDEDVTLSMVDSSLWNLNRIYLNIFSTCRPHLYQTMLLSMSCPLNMIHMQYPTQTKLIQIWLFLKVTIRKHSHVVYAFKPPLNFGHGRVITTHCSTDVEVITYLCHNPNVC